MGNLMATLSTYVARNPGRSYGGMLTIIPAGCIEGGLSGRTVISSSAEDGAKAALRQAPEIYVVDIRTSEHQTIK
jgi:hypothetical protein